MLVAGTGLRVRPGGIGCQLSGIVARKRSRCIIGTSPCSNSFRSESNVLLHLAQTNLLSSVTGAHQLLLDRNAGQQLSCSCCACRLCIQKMGPHCVVCALTSTTQNKFAPPTMTHCTSHGLKTMRTNRPPSACASTIASHVDTAYNAPP